MLTKGIASQMPNGEEGCWPYAELRNKAFEYLQVLLLLLSHVLNGINQSERSCSDAQPKRKLSLMPKRLCQSIVGLPLLVVSCAKV